MTKFSNKPMRELRIRIKRGWLKDLVFLVAAYFVLLSLFANGTRWQMIDHIYTSIFLGTLVIFGTINGWVIRQKFLDRRKAAWFFVFTALNMLAGAAFNYILFDKLIDYVLPGYYFISYYSYLDLVKFFFVYISLLTLLDLSWEWFQIQEARNQVVMLEKEKKDAELRALTNQVNPHFLFNSLTVLYSLSLAKSPDTSGAIIKLSDILRYVIYEAATDKVTLASETLLIKNYIDLQRYRSNPSTRITFTADVSDKNSPIEPMIFLPLVENGFKHGTNSESGDGFIDIVLHEKDGLITFKVTNNKTLSPSNEQSYGGIGLKNIEERLKLVYRDAHSFAVEESEKIFSVHLTVNYAA